MSLNDNLSSDNIRTTKELILDEQKLVTYLSLSKDLCIHVNEAKILLNEVVEEIKGNDASVSLNVTYLLSGLTSNNRGVTTVCSETELKTRKNGFKTVFFQHIYSVCRGSSKIDNAAFASISKFEDILLCAGLIKGVSCTKRSMDEIGTLKSSCQKPVDEKVPVKKEKEKPSNATTKDINVVKVHETKSEPVIKSEVTSPKKDSTNIPNAKSSTKNGVNPAKGIAGFFTKSNSAPSTKPIKFVREIVKEEEEPVQKKMKETETKKIIGQEHEMVIDVEVPVREIKKEPTSTKKSNNKNGSLSAIKKNAKVDKKRKRVLHVSDSESDEDIDPFANDKDDTPPHESDDEIPPTPTVNTIKITSGILNPKKRRKVVDKTYTDEEGYILTRKEEIYESCSEEEMEVVKSEPVLVKPEKENVEQTNKVKSEVSPKEKKPKNTKKKVSPPQKGKQANIMNFFKKV